MWSQAEPDSFTTDSKHSHLQHQAGANQTKPKLETRKQQHGPLPPSLNAIHNSASTGLCQMWLLGSSHNSVTPKNRAASTRKATSSDVRCIAGCRESILQLEITNYLASHTYLCYTFNTRQGAVKGRELCFLSSHSYSHFQPQQSKGYSALLLIQTR